MAVTTDFATVPADRQLTLTRLLDAPRDLVFDIWTTREHVMRWWGPKDFVVEAMDWDFRIGGAYHFLMTNPTYGSPAAGGVFLEISPKDRIVFTFKWDEGSGIQTDTVITVTFEAQGGKTLITFHQTPFDTVEQRDSHAGGWGSMLDKIEGFLASGAA